MKGQLYPYYDLEAEILELTNSIEENWPYGIDIDGTIIFDFDKKFILSNVDILVPKKYWKIKDKLEIPLPTKKGILIIKNQSLEKKSFNLPIEITRDKANKYVKIIFDKRNNYSKVIELSNKVYALLRNKNLNGFFVHF